MLRKQYPMGGTKLVNVTPFKKNPSWNVFEVFSDMPRAKQATVDMKAVVDKFLVEHKRVAKKYEKEGLSDSASRDMIMKYIMQRIY